MRLRSRICLPILLLTAAVFGTWRGKAFSLLGPFQPWMQQTNGLDEPGDIGGPMSIGEGYRWNVPVITYGFDKSFVDFFGTNGEAAVESAIQILNDLPPASRMDLANYPFNSMNHNYEAEAKNLIDLKSWALPLILEHMGLTTPSRYVFVLRQWNPVFIQDDKSSDWPTWVYPDYISERNFDPQTYEASQYVNDALYAGFLTTQGDDNWISSEWVLPYGIPYDAVADFFENDEPPGTFFIGLTRDDVGGFGYLLSTNNIAYETLLPDVHGVGTNACSFVNGAWRPGLDKITFIPQPTNPRTGEFLPKIIRYTDTYITNGVQMHQQLARVIRKPDFLFRAADLGGSEPYVSLAYRNGITNWINNATLNENVAGGGPGVIQPPVNIVFDKLGLNYHDYDFPSGYWPLDPQSWASFDGTTNAPIIFPAPRTGTSRMTFRLWIWNIAENLQKSFTWKRSSLIGTQYALQTSPDLVNWTTLFIVTNNGSVCTYVVESLSGAGQFYRLQLVK